MRQRISQSNKVPRLLLVVLAILGCQGVVAQTPADDSGLCCPTGYFASGLAAIFELGTTRERVDEIAEELGLQVTSFHDFIHFGPISRFCAPLGEESALATMLGAFPEVRLAEWDSVGCISELPRCECCPCGFVCEIPGYELPPCDPECVPDADADSFADSCDACTDTDGDGFGNPEFDASFTCPIDNCPDAVNPDQADLDGDGIGDACDRKLTICHRPPGRPVGAVTITISERASSAHLAHGDVPGECGHGPAVIGLLPSTLIYGVGESVVLEVLIAGARYVDTVTFSLRYEPAVVRYVGATEGTFMNDDGRQTAFLTTPTAGDEIEVTLSRRGGGQGAAGTGLLATVEFLAVGVGDAGFAFTGASVEDPQGRFLPAVFNTAPILVVP